MPPSDSKLAHCLGLKPIWLDTLLAILTDKVPDYDVWAYGSRAMGQAHTGSDLDIVLIYPKSPDEHRCLNLGPIREALDDSSIPIEVDVLDWASLPTTFKQTIDTHKICLRKAK
jgi:uncharacterized protein